MLLNPQLRTLIFACSVATATHACSPLRVSATSRPTFRKARPRDVKKKLTPFCSALYFFLHVYALQKAHQYHHLPQAAARPNLGTSAGRTSPPTRFPSATMPILEQRSRAMLPRQRNARTRRSARLDLHAESSVNHPPFSHLDSC